MENTDLDMNKVGEALQQFLKKPILYDEPMRLHTTWKIGGPADLFLQPADEDELAQVLKFLHENEIPWLAIGNGSNLLVGDKGIRGAVIKMGEAFSGTHWEENTVEVKAGTLLAVLSLEAAERSFSGLEFARGIPGSMGGAVRMNAGAYGGNIGNYVIRVNGVSFTGEPVTVEGEALSFAYRNSSLFDLDAIVTRVTLKLEPGNREQSLEMMKDFLQRRSLAQPLEYPSCGSVFRNPPNEHAGLLVENTGLRGLKIGNAQVSLKHGNFIVNLGGATAADVRELISEVQEQVYAYTGIRLEPEVKFVGEFK